MDDVVGIEELFVHIKPAEAAAFSNFVEVQSYQFPEGVIWYQLRLPPLCSGEQHPPAPLEGGIFGKIPSLKGIKGMQQSVVGEKSWKDRDIA
jgi:hypothetical protein